MPLSAAFTASQAIGLPNEVTFTDTSTGSDATITERRIYCRMADGEYLVEDGTTTDYEVWDYADSSITLDLLDRSMALTIIVQWLNAGGDVVYTSEEVYVFTLHDYLFAYELLQGQASTLNPNILQDTNFYENSIRLITNIWNAEIAIEKASDVTGAQFALDRNYNLITNESKYF